MWWIFPQLEGLGFSETSKKYSLQNLEEATQYLQHPVLGKRLMEITAVTLDLEGKTAYQIFGTPDDLKLKSSMTLFAEVPGSSPLFQATLEKYFQGKADSRTLELLNKK